MGVQRRIVVKKDIQPSFFRLDKHLRAAPSMAIIMLGMGGALYFGINVNRPVELRLASSAVAVVEQQASLPPSPKALPPAQPIKVRVPKVGIDAGLVELGMKADRTIETPSTYVDAGWYKLGRTPGEIGPAVIVGHVDSAKDGPAVFWRLRELQPGDIIEVDRSDSTTARFKVDKIEQFSQSEFPTDQVYGNIDYAGVRLITCGGAYDGKVNRYSHNTVVFGSLLI